MSQDKGIDFQSDYDYRIEGGDGLYTMTWTNIGVEATIDRITDNRNNETKGEVWVNSIGSSSGHLKQGQITLTSPTSRRTFATALEKRIPDLDWDQIIEQISIAVLRDYRKGVPEVEISGTIIPEAAELNRWMVKPILEVRNPTIIYGPGSVGKSLFSLYLAILAHEGMSVEGLEIEEEVRVLYLDWETSLEEIADRVRIIRAGLDLPKKAETGIWYKKMDFGIANDLPELKRVIRKHDIGLLVIDSMGYAASGDLESSSSARDLFSSLRSLNVTSLCIHHISKESMAGGRSSVNRPFGSIYFENAARHTFELKKEQGEGEDFIEMAMYDRKANNVKRIAPIGWELTFAPGENDVAESVVFTRRAVRNTRLRDTMRVVDQIENLLREAGPMNRTEIAEALDKSPGQISKELSNNREKFAKGEGDLWTNIYLPKNEDGIEKRMNLGDV